jgi:hypothetical protein
MISVFLIKLIKNAKLDEFNLWNMPFKKLDGNSRNLHAVR